MSSHLDELFEGLPERMTVQQLADVLGLKNVKAAYRWLNAGVIPAYKVGPTWLILRDEVKEALRAGANTPQSPVPSEDDPGPHKE